MIEMLFNLMKLINLQIRLLQNNFLSTRSFLLIFMTIFLFPMENMSKSFFLFLIN